MNRLSHIMGMKGRGGGGGCFLDSQSFFIGFPGLANMFQTLSARSNVQ